MCTCSTTVFVDSLSLSLSHLHTTPCVETLANSDMHCPVNGFKSVNKPNLYTFMAIMKLNPKLLEPPDYKKSL